jgi:hypothetical protein
MEESATSPRVARRLRRLSTRGKTTVIHSAAECNPKQHQGAFMKDQQSLPQPMVLKARQAYEVPTLVKYGAVSVLTAAGSSTTKVNFRQEARGHRHGRF